MSPAVITSAPLKIESGEMSSSVVGEGSSGSSGAAQAAAAALQMRAGVGAAKGAPQDNDDESSSRSPSPAGGASSAATETEDDIWPEDVEQYVAGRKGSICCFCGVCEGCGAVCVIAQLRAS